jgi:hypothetical protein
VRVALLHHDHGAGGATAHVHELARALAAAGHDGEVVSASCALPDAPLRLRKIGERPGRLPGSYLTLRAGEHDVAHAFTPQDAVSALLWSRRTGRPAIFTQFEPLNRGKLANRRLRLALLRRALERSHAVLAPDTDTAESLRRWMAVESRVVAPGSAEGHLAVYEELQRR